jgi:hypothetical protein
VDDGVSGWIAADGSAEGLAAALTRALATPPDRRREMGRAAAAAVQRICDAPAIAARHVTYKSALARAGTADVRAPAADVEVEVVEVGGDAAGQADPAAREAAALRAAISRPGTAPVAFVDAGLQVVPSALATLAAWLAHDPRLGVVAGWTLRTMPAPRVDVPPVPSRPHQNDAGGMAPLVVVRRAALPPEATSRRALCDQILAGDWQGATCPRVLGTTATPSAPVPLAARQFSSMALAIQRLHTPLLQWLRTTAPDARRRFLLDALRHPLRSASGVLQRLRRPAAPAHGQDAGR